MPLSPTTLTAQIKAEINSRNPELFSTFTEGELDWLFEAIASAVVNHIRTNLVVTGTTTQPCTAGGAAGTFVSTSVS